MAPKAEKKPAKKVAKKVAGGKGKKGKSKVESFKIYIYKVLKQVRAGPGRPLSLSIYASELMKVIFILQQDSYGALVTSLAVLHCRDQMRFIGASGIYSETEWKRCGL